MGDSSLDNSPATVHDEFIADTFYTTGWTTKATSDLCRNKSCGCKGSGSCKYGIFNHYMTPVDSESFDDEHPHMVFPIFLSNRNADEISAEEVRCSPDTLQGSYAYFLTQVMESPAEQTLVSVVLNRCKSACFSVRCRLVEMEAGKAPQGSFCLPSPRDGDVCVLAYEGSVLTPLLESICLIGVDPVVSPKGVYSVTCSRRDGKVYSMDLYTAGFTFSAECGVNLLGSMREGAVEEVLWCDSDGVKAVRTAVVTLSVILTPKSFYGGKNPSTKSVQYHIHNVELE